MSNQYTPDVVLPPGETVLELMRDREMSYSGLASFLDMKLDALDKIIDGTRPIDVDIAWRLQAAFGVDASFWLSLEKNYRDSRKELGLEVKNGNT